MAKAELITNAANTLGKQLSDIGQYIKNTAKSMSQTPTTQTAAHNFAKWGAPLAGAGAGAAALGGGAYLALHEVSAAVDDTISPKVENVSKIGGIVILLGILFIVAKYILPEIKGVLR